ncbi:hypothetical protein [Pseudomonas zeae]|uniref:hypothetical protein n=1 Tax=Pseudomonas zeae TaxID=2745510 RepID=UPI0039E12C9D
MSKEFVQTFISWSGFAISICLLFLQIKNRVTQVSSYNLSRAAYRSGTIVLKLVNVVQLEDSVLMKLVIFNPGSVAAVIQSCSIFERPKNKNWFWRFFTSKWQRVERSLWWPIQDGSDTEPKYLADAYQQLYVKDVRSIYVSMPGMTDRRRYLFEVRTNNGYVTTETSVMDGRTFFSHHFEEWGKD